GGAGDNGGGGGGRVRGQTALGLQLADLRGDFFDDAAERLGGHVGVLLVEHEARDEHGDRHERAETQQGTETERGGAAGRLVFNDAADGDGDDPEDGVKASQGGSVLQATDFPDVGGVDLSQAVPEAEDRAHVQDPMLCRTSTALPARPSRATTALSTRLR